jgi:hypothetical protein
MTAGAEEERSEMPRQISGLPTELIRHAVLCWEAEVENARRHANRMNLLLPVILGVLGLGAFNLGWMGDRTPTVEPRWATQVVRVLQLGSLLLFMRSLLILLTVRLRARPRTTASFRLSLSEEIASNSETLDGAEVARAVFKCTYGAALDLRRRNATEQVRIDRGQQALLLATLHALLAVACYTLFAALPLRRL